MVYGHIKTKAKWERGRKPTTDNTMMSYSFVFDVGGWEGGEKTWPASKPCPGLTTTTSPTYCTTAWPSDASNCVTMGTSRS